MITENYTLVVNGNYVFERPLLPSDMLFTEDAYIATWSGAEVAEANAYGGYAGAYFYSTVTITPPADGDYDFTVQSATGFSYTGNPGDADTQLWLYEGSFDPTHPLVNLVAANEDIDTYTDEGLFGNLLSKLGGVSLHAGVKYVLVLGGRDAGLTGSAVVSFSDAAPPVPVTPLPDESTGTEPQPQVPPAETAPPPPTGAAEGDTNVGEMLLGSSGNDPLVGGGGDDLFIPGLGHDTIVGGAGHDTVQLSGKASAYKMQVVNGNLVLSGGADSYAMSDIETLSYAGGQGSSPTEVAARLYKGILGREGNGFELDYWAGVLQSGYSAKDVATSFVNSAEAADLFRTSGSAGFVTGLYESVLGRTPAASEVEYWVGGIGQGLDRADLALQFVNSAEYLGQAVEVDLGSSDVGMLLRLYYTMMNRAPDEAGLNFWLEQRANGASMRSIADSFAHATEAGNLSDSAFIDRIYDAGLHRDPTTTEKSYLMSLFEGGLDRGQILLQISESHDAVQLVGVIDSTITLV
ncbi:DUF4214 domain-containing protein [Massilia sp. METH4]|uniref:DUF4214 domain-containing protein n=1 Tax=Massilia sp. METH4 TaxID=3123041 RepID=UPI0030CBE18F